MVKVKDKAVVTIKNSWKNTGCSLQRHRHTSSGLWCVLKVKDKVRHLLCSSVSRKSTEWRKKTWEETEVLVLFAWRTTCLKDSDTQWNVFLWIHVLCSRCCRRSSSNWWLHSFTGVKLKTPINVVTRWCLIAPCSSKWSFISVTTFWNPDLPRRTHINNRMWKQI